MNKFTVAAKRFGGFMKRNAFYLLIILCIASVAAVIGLAVTHNTNDPVVPIVVDPVDPNGDNGDETPVEPTPDKQTFIAPTNGNLEIDYLDLAIANETKTAYFNDTLNQFTMHQWLDFLPDSPNDLSVFAVTGGVVKDTGYNQLLGNYVIISHDNNYESAYYSLESKSELKEGETIKQGQLLGNMSDTAESFAHLGNHLHFEMSKQGTLIDPKTVIALDNK